MGNILKFDAKQTLLVVLAAAVKKSAQLSGYTYMCND